MDPRFIKTKHFYSIVVSIIIIITTPALGDNISDPVPVNSNSDTPAAADHLPVESSPSASASASERHSMIQGTVSLETGYRKDDLDWNIAGNINGNTPNILSELTWEDLESYQIRLTGAMDIQQQLIIKGSIAYGNIYNGKNQDSDYNGDNRTLEFSRSNNSSDDGSLWDLYFGIGPRFDFGLNYFNMVPMVGYSLHMQNLSITDGYQTIDTVDNDPGPFAGLDSSYETVWQGPWLGIDLELNAMQPLWIFREARFHVSYEYHWATYYAEANWNLRSDFEHPKSFEHDASGYGIVYAMGATVFLSEQLSLALSYDYHQWETDKGSDIVYLTDGTTSITRLNRVRWNGSALYLGVAYYF